MHRWLVVVRREMAWEPPPRKRSLQVLRRAAAAVAAAVLVGGQMRRRMGRTSAVGRHRAGGRREKSATHFPALHESHTVRNMPAA